MKLNRYAIDDYELEILTDPQVTDWEASFDRGVTWHDSVDVPPVPPETVSTRFRWLVAGSKATPEPDAVDQPVAVVAETITPIIRLKADPRQLVRSAEKIRVWG